MEVELPLESVSTLQQPREQGLLAKGRGEKASESQALFVPAASGQQGEQEAQCYPRSALPLPTLPVLQGLPRTCLKTSGSAELSECAGGMNRLLHVLLTWPGRVDPLAGPQAQGQGP